VTMADDGITVVGFLGDTWYAMAPSPAVDDALRLVDPAALRAATEPVHRDLASFLCVACGAVYCEAHWSPEIRFDPDDPGWYDETVGTCPAGHRQQLDD
jgi:hypothetical protein